MAWRRRLLRKMESLRVETWNTWAELAWVTHMTLAPPSVNTWKWIDIIIILFSPTKQYMHCLTTSLTTDFRHFLSKLSEWLSWERFCRTSQSTMSPHARQVGSNEKRSHWNNSNKKSINWRGQVKRCCYTNWNFVTSECWPHFLGQSHRQAPFWHCTTYTVKAYKHRHTRVCPYCYYWMLPM